MRFYFYSGVLKQKEEIYLYNWIGYGYFRTKEDAINHAKIEINEQVLLEKTFSKLEDWEPLTFCAGEITDTSTDLYVYSGIAIGLRENGTVLIHNYASVDFFDDQFKALEFAKIKATENAEEQWDKGATCFGIYSTKALLVS